VGFDLGLLGWMSRDGEKPDLGLGWTTTSIATAAIVLLRVINPSQ